MIGENTRYLNEQQKIFRELRDYFQISKNYSSVWGMLLETLILHR